MTRRARPTAGIGALLGKSAELLRETQTVTRLALGELRPGAGQPRREFDDQRLEELTASVREKGILQPLLVRPVPGGYEIVAGERRYRAADRAGLGEVPVVVREMSDEEAREAALIENLQREDLNVLDEVDGKLALIAQRLGLPAGEVQPRLMRMLREEPADDHAALDALFAGLGETWPSFARNKLRVLSWPDELLTAVRAGLRYSLGSVIAGAPAEHHPHLLGMAQGGASKRELVAELARLAAPTSRPQAARVGRVLSSARWRSGLSDAEARAVEKWLEKAPEVVRSALGEERYFRK